MNEFSSVSVTSANMGVCLIVRAIARMNENLISKGSKHMIGVARSVDEAKSGCG
jgi:hypothetical protein